MDRFDWFGHYDSRFGLIERVLGHFNTFGPIKNFRISAEELSQLFCRIHRKFIVVKFANKWTDLIGLDIMILNLDLLKEF